MALEEETARRLLQQERTRLETAITTVESDLEEERSGADEELAAYDQHPAEEGTEVHDMARDLGLRTDLQVRLDENAEALGRVEDGTYGRCERCGQEIGDERLRAMPSTRYCVEDQQAMDEA